MSRCGYCGGSAVPGEIGYVHGDDTVTPAVGGPGDMVTARHRPGTAVLAVDLVDDDEEDGTSGAVPAGWFDIRIRTGVLHLSEQYAGLRMRQLGVVDQGTEVVLGETVHDALMGAFQAGALAATEGLSVSEAINRLGASHTP